MEQEFTIMTLALWLYKSFSLVFVITFFGSLMYDLMDTIKRKTKIGIKRTLISSLICSFVITPIFDLVKNIDFSIFILICFLIGLWSNKLANYILDWRFAKKFLGLFIKELGKDISETVMKTIDTIDKEDKNKIDNDNSNDDK